MRKIFLFFKGDCPIYLILPHKCTQESETNYLFLRKYNQNSEEGLFCWNNIMPKIIHF